jgi:phage regulator Rha-like protein
MKSNETRVKEINEVYIKKYDELEKELKVKIDSTNTILKNINTNMYSIQKKIPNFR